MKKHTALFLIMIALTVLLCSCFEDKTNDTVKPPCDNIVGDFIFKDGSDITFVISKTVSSEKITSEGVEIDNPDYSKKYVDVSQKIYKALGESDAGLNLTSVSDGSAKAKHEIIFGLCDRAISKEAYRILEKIPADERKSRFVVYSNATSVAIAFEPGDYDVADVAAEYFIANYITGNNSLTLDLGYTYTDNVDMIAYYEKIGEEKIDAQWAKLEEELLDSYKKHYGEGNESQATSLVKSTMEALRTFYSSYDADKLVSWFANLYEPKICVCNAVENLEECKGTPYCGGAGFYFSNSGRDTVGFMPDIETTAQVFGFLKNSGMLDSVNGDVSAAFPDGEAEKIVAWVKSMQDPDDGFFYHPQWSKQETQANKSRMNRDLSYGISILNNFGAKPNYSTPSGVVGDSEAIPTSAFSMSKSLLTGRLGAETKNVAASRVVLVADGVPAHLASEAAFRKYLSGLNIRGNSYYVANELTSMSAQIKTRDTELKAQGAGYSLVDILEAWAKENQNPVDGTWHWGAIDDPYYANNGVLKMATLYTDLGIEFPNPMLAINNAIKALTCDTPINHVCDLYNTWFAIYFICNNLRSFGNSEAAQEVVWGLREQAPAAIRETAVKMSACRCDDWSFSYFPGKTCTTSQGLPVAAPTAFGSPAAGDVNATVICTYGNINYMFGALGFTGAPDICTEADRIKFKGIISELDQVIKLAELDPYVPDTFDGYEVGSQPKSYTFLLGNGSVDSSLTVEEDTREGADGNVLNFHSGIGSWDCFNFGTNTGIGGEAYIFETDMCFKNVTYMNGSEEVDLVNGWALQLQLGSGQNATKGFYGIIFRFEAGKILVMDFSSGKDGSISSRYTELFTVEKGEWFHIKVEYYNIDEHNARVKVYFGATREDMELVRVSDNYFDYYANKIDNPEAIVPEIGAYASNMISTTTAYNETILFDNFCAYRSRISYKPDETLPLDKNVDGPDRDEKKYSFADLETIPEDIKILSGDGTVSIVENNKGSFLNLASGKIEIPANYRTSGANVASFSADVLWNGGSNKLLSLHFTDGETKVYDVLGFDFKTKQIQGEDYLVLCERKGNGSEGSAIELVKIQLGVKTNIRIDFYHDENVAILYVDDTFITVSDAVYSNTRPRLINKVTVQTYDGTVMLDNIIFEKFKYDFKDAVEPDDPSDVHEFDDLQDETDRGVVFEKVNVRDGFAELLGVQSSIKLPLDIRTPLLSTYLVKTDIVVPENAGDVLTLAILDESGNIIVAVNVSIETSYDGTVVKVYEMGKGGRYDLVIATATLPYGNNPNVSLEWYPDELCANILIDGKAYGTTSVCYDVGVVKNTPAYGAIYGVGTAEVKIDNMIAEALYKYRTPTVLDAINPENGSENLTYDFSSATNLPKAFTMSLFAGGSNVRVEQALKKIGEAKEVYSKALVIDKKTGGNDEFKFNPSNTTAGANRVVFESEMMFSSTSSNTGVIFQVMFTAKSNALSSSTFMPTLGVLNGKVVLNIHSSTGKTGTDLRYENEYIELADVDEWFKLRIEYYQGTKETVRIVITVNDGEPVNVLKSGEVVGTLNEIVSDNYYGWRSTSAPNAEPRNNIEQVLFYSQNSPYATVYMDNTKFFGDGATCDKDVTYIKTAK